MLRVHRNSVAIAKKHHECEAVLIARRLYGPIGAGAAKVLLFLSAYAYRNCVAVA